MTLIELKNINDLVKQLRLAIEALAVRVATLESEVSHLLKCAGGK